MALRRACPDLAQHLHDVPDHLVAMDELPGRQGHELQLWRFRQHHPPDQGSGIHPCPRQHLHLLCRAGPHHDHSRAGLRQCAQRPDAALPRVLPHGDLFALRDLADRLFDAVQVDVRRRRGHQQGAPGGTPHRRTDPLVRRSVLGQGRGHPRHHLALDRLQYGVLSGGNAELRPLDLRGRPHRRRPRLGPLPLPHHSDAEAGDPVHHRDLHHRHAAAFRRGL